ncbi:MAG: inorganic phosphate transporter [Bacilli bacterium]|nr:inorganic phosphate transporter [Bacilli bacterium]
MSIGQFFSLLGQYPWAIAACIACLGVAFINGWTDGPNSIATAVNTRCLRPTPAVILCAVGNVAGALFIGALGTWLADAASLPKTIASLAQYELTSPAYIQDALAAITAGLGTVLLWSGLSLFVSLPCSESNELIAGITGSAIGVAIMHGQGWFDLVGWGAWGKVLIGFFGSLIFGFAMGLGLTKLLELICRKMTRGKTNRFFKKGQVFSAALMSFAHGFQDGAKFIGIFILIAVVMQGTTSIDPSLLSIWYFYVPVALMMGVGSMMGGYSIIKTLGKSVSKLERHQAFATDIASVIGLGLATFFGLPVSSGTVKATSIMGGGASKGLRKVKWGVSGKMIGSWVIVFPIGIVVGATLTCIFLFFSHLF